MFVYSCIIPIVGMPSFALTVGTEGAAFTFDVRYRSPTGAESQPISLSVPQNGLVSHRFDPSSLGTYFPNGCGAVTLLARNPPTRFSAWARPKPGDDWHCVSGPPHMGTSYAIPFAPGTKRLTLAISNLGGASTVDVRKKDGGFSTRDSLPQNATHLWSRSGNDVSSGGFLEVNCSSDIAVCLYGETGSVQYHLYPDAV